MPHALAPAVEKLIHRLASAWVIGIAILVQKNNTLGNDFIKELDRTRLAALSLFTVQSPDSVYSCPANSANTYLAVAGTARYALLAAVSSCEAGSPALAAIESTISSVVIMAPA